MQVVLYYGHKMMVCIYILCSCHTPWICYTHQGNDNFPREPGSSGCLLDDKHWLLLCGRQTVSDASQRH